MTTATATAQAAERLRLGTARTAARPRNPLGRDAPILPLGYEGQRFHFIDVGGQLVTLGARELTRTGIVGLFGGRRGWLVARKGLQATDRAGAPIHDFRVNAAVELLISACHERGPWSPRGRVRGRGAWAGEDGDLVGHVGDALLVKPRRAGTFRVARPGERGGYVYPTADPLARPSREPQPGGARGPAAEMLALLDCWEWRLPGLAPRLLLGLFAASKLGAGLERRAHGWITGERSSGKSRLFAALNAAHGRGGMLVLSDPTEAGLRSVARHDSLPILADEAEPEGDGSKLRGVVKVGRLSATGSVVARGAPDGIGADYTLVSPMMLSSIYMPRLDSQDRARFAVLELLALGGELPIDGPQWGELGAAVWRRMIDGYGPRLAATLEACRMALRDAGWRGHAAELYAVILAAAHVALADHEPRHDELEAWCELLAPLMGDHDATELDTGERCRLALMTAPLDPLRSGGRQPVWWHLRRAGGWGEVGNRSEAEARGHARMSEEAVASARLLDMVGMRLRTLDGVRHLAIANNHRGLDSIFAGTAFADGAWPGALLRLPDARRGSGHHWAGVQSRVVLVPLAVMIDGWLGDDG